MALAFSSSTSSTSIGFSSSSSTLSHNVQAVFKVSGNNNFQPLDRSHRALPLNVSRNGFDTLKALNARNVSIVPSAATTFAPADVDKRVEWLQSEQYSAAGDIFGEPQKTARVRDEYQAQIPSFGVSKGLLVS